MEWSDVAQALGKAAPILGTLIGGPAGAAVGALAASALGVEATPAAVAAALQDPQAAIKLAEIERSRQVDLQGLLVQAEQARLTADTEAQRIAGADRASARQANVAGGIQGRVFALVLVIFVVVMGLEGAVLFVGLPKGVDGYTAGRILGTLDAALLAALYYVFGSSAGSARKDGLIAQAAPPAR